MKRKQTADAHFPIIAKALVARGDFKMIVLTVLQERPMHGYEISTFIEEQSQGFYRPSPGAIYPALRTLLNKGYVRIKSEERRKIYQITPAGRRLLREKHAQIERGIRAFKEAIGPERAMLMLEMHRTAKLIVMAGRDITPSQAKKLSRIMNEARESMLRIISE